MLHYSRRTLMIAAAIVLIAILIFASRSTSNTSQAVVPAAIPTNGLVTAEDQAAKPAAPAPAAMNNAYEVDGVPAGAETVVDGNNNIADVPPPDQRN